MRPVKKVTRKGGTQERPITDKKGVTTHPVGKTFGIHPVAAIFPKMQDSELQELGEDMKIHGQRDPVVLEKKTDLIIDGQNREAAARLAGTQLKTIYYAGEDIVEFVVSKNMLRRMMTTEQKAMAAVKIANMKRGDNQHSGQTGSANLRNLGGETITQKDAATMFGVSVRTIQDAKKVLDSNDEELIQKLETGRISVSAAARKLQQEVKNTSENENANKDKDKDALINSFC